MRVMVKQESVMQPIRQLLTSQLKATPLNNLGSVVIDGMLIQHMKITTKDYKEKTMKKNILFSSLLLVLFLLMQIFAKFK